jgi:hypothetical protein
MSYDLMVFDPQTAPRESAAFKDWYHRQAEWSEGHSYDDPVVTTPDLRSWYEAIRLIFPNMNGPGAPTDEELMTPGVEDRLAGYSIGRHVIYADFRWTEAEEAYATVRRLAVEHNVGFYDVSGDEGDGEIHFPGEELRPESAGAWRDVSRQFQELQQPAPAPKRRWFDIFRRN